MFSMSIEREFFFYICCYKKLKLQFFALKDLTVSLRSKNENSISYLSKEISLKLASVPRLSDSDLCEGFGKFANRNFSAEIYIPDEVKLKALTNEMLIALR